MGPRKELFFQKAENRLLSLSKSKHKSVFFIAFLISPLIMPKIKKQKSFSIDKENTEIYLVASGDLRLSANQKCWPIQDKMEKDLSQLIEKRFNKKVIRAHPFNPNANHGFIDSQKMGIQVFQNIPKDKPLIVAEAVWQYSYHVLPGLMEHEGPILTIGNWEPTWPGLVGLLNLNASLTRVGKNYATLWSVDFQDDFFLKGMTNWIETGEIEHEESHVTLIKIKKQLKVYKAEKERGDRLAEELKKKKAIMGIFDEGCMGMVNAIFDDDLLNKIGIFKERLSQSALVSRMGTVTQEEALGVYRWLQQAGVQFYLGQNEETDLTERQIIEQCKMYIAAGRIAYDYGCDVIGIQYQQGLKDSVPASDLVEGMLNNKNRPPIFLYQGSDQEIFPNQPIVHFNEVDQGSAVDALITNRVLTDMELDPATTLHDIRWGEHYKNEALNINDFVWVFEISGAVPASHFANGWKSASSMRQPPMYFPLGGGTLRGVSKPGPIVWSRVYQAGRQLCVDLGKGTVVDLPPEELERRWKATTYEWPIMNCILTGVTRDQMMSKHKSNHIQVVYAPDEEQATSILYSKAAFFFALGQFEVRICGV